mgnify:CR=1 FL=1
MVGDMKYYNGVKRRLLREKGPEVEALGYNLACGIGMKEEKISLEARLQPLPGSQDPISEDLFARIKSDLEKYLLNNGDDVPLNIRYTGVITPR